MTGPFPVREDDEMGFLAASLNGVALAMREASEDAETDRSQMSTILWSMDSGVILTDASGRALLVNPAAERRLGRPASELMRRTLLDSLRQTDLADRIAGATFRGETSSFVLDVPASGRQLLARVSPSVQRSPGSGAVVVLQDQEEQRRLDAVRRDFIANVSHELRTPLSSIRAMAETLQMGAREDASVADSFLGIIIKESDRLANLTNDILNLARYEAGRLEVQRVDLRALLEEVESQVRPNAERVGLKMSLDMGELPELQGDRAALRQVFLNLLDNAVKYTTEGTVSLSACRWDGQRQLATAPASPGRVGDHKEGAGPLSWVKVEITDTGPGIASQHVSRIFERFYRVDKGRSRDLGGTGLGLSIVRHVVESHGGSVEVASTPGQGSTFTVWLPVFETVRGAAQGPDG
jgi:two-component system phosphate regulon sensor histidine kinase PhoR